MENEKMILRTPDYIQATVSAFYNVPIEKLPAKTRKREIAFARQVCFHLYKLFTVFSLKSIGEFFGDRDHSTVMYGLNVVKNLMDTNEVIREQVRALEGNVRDVARSQAGWKPLTDEQMEFIFINHWLMTAREMAFELGVNYLDVKAYCDQKGYEPITEKLRAVEFIRAHPTWNLNKFSKQLNLSRDIVRSLCQRYELPYATKKITLVA